MFLKTYYELRKYILTKKSISSLIQLEYNSFNEIAMVPVCTFILSNFELNYKGIYYKLSEFKGNMEVQNNKVKEAILNNNVNYTFNTCCKNFLKIPDYPIAYWANSNLINSFSEGKKLDLFSKVKSGLVTGNNDLFLRFWFEVDYNYCNFNEKSTNEHEKWFALNKGGNFKRWYGNQYFVIDWENDGFNLKNYKKSSVPPNSFPCEPSISWSSVTNGKIAFRYYPDNFIFNNKGCSIFIKNKMYKKYIFGFLNSSVCQDILDFMAPTIDYPVGKISSLPILWLCPIWY